MNELNIEITVPIKQEHFTNVIVTALEGGSNYWISEIKVKEGFVLPGDGSFAEKIAKALFENSEYAIDYVVEIVDEDGDSHKLSQAKLLNGFRYAQLKHPQVFADEYDLEKYNGDATSSDIILQLALFGEIVYG